MKPYIPITKSVLSANPWWKYCRDQIELPFGKIGEFHYVFTNGSSMVVPVEKDGRLLLVRQYRYTGNRGSIEFPCGGVEDGSNCDATARNELVEETGFSIAKMGEVDLEMYLGRNKEAREAKRHLNKS